MIALLLAWITILFVGISLGKGSIKIYGVVTNTFAAEQYDLFDTFFIGLCMNGALASIWSIFFPLNKYALLFLLVLALLYWLINWGETLRIVSFSIKDLSIANKFIIPFILIISGVLLFSITKAISYDTPLYHTQTILWNENFPAVPGLANLHDRFGFNSTLLVLSSVYSFTFLFKQPIFAINSIAILFFTIWLAKAIIEKPGIRSVICLIVYHLFFLYYYDNISSPSTDLFPNLLCLYLLLRILIEDHHIETSSLVYLVLPLFCVTLKLSVFPIALLSCLMLYRLQFFHIKKIGIILLIGSAIIIPWIIRNIILTGYLLYPQPVIDLFNFDWKVPANHAESSKNWVYSWARIPGLNEAEVLKMNIFEWVPKWWHGLSGLSIVLFLLSVISPITLLGIKVFAPLKNMENRPEDALKNADNKNTDLTFVWLVAFLGFIFWFLTAPATRFSYSFLLVLSILLVLLLEKPISKIEKVIKPITYLMLLILNASFVIKGYSGLATYEVSSWIYTPQYSSGSGIDFTVHKLGTIEMYAPLREDQCFDKFPCMPGFSSNIKMRGKSIKNGFRYDERIYDSTGIYQLSNGIIYKNNVTIYNSNYKNEPAIRLFLNPKGYAEFTTSTGSIWTSEAGWTDLPVFKDTSGSYQMRDGVVYQNGNSLFDSRYKNEFATELYLNSDSVVEFVISTGSIWNSEAAWIK